MVHEDITMQELRLALEKITHRLDSQDTTYAERRREDDKRAERASQERQEVLERVDAHGRRTSALETRWDAFFGPLGAFGQFTTRIDQHDSKLDKVLWMLGIGLGIVITVQFMLKH